MDYACPLPRCTGTKNGRSEDRIEIGVQGSSGFDLCYNQNAREVVGCTVLAYVTCPSEMINYLKKRVKSVVTDHLEDSEHLDKKGRSFSQTVKYMDDTINMISPNLEALSFTITCRSQSIEKGAVWTSR